MLPAQFKAFFFVASARRFSLRVLSLLVFLWLMMAPLRGLADNPPGAPPNTHIMLYMPQGQAQDVTAQFDANDGHVYDFCGNPPIPVRFDYAAKQVFNAQTGALIGYLLYPGQFYSGK